MNKTRITRWLSFILCVVLTAAMALTTIGCNTANENTDTEAPYVGTGATATDTEAPSSGSGTTAAEDDTAADPNAPIVKGEGSTVFSFQVVDGDGNETNFEIHTDKTTVGEALLELDLIAGEEGPYGLYVKTVNGITADYDVDGTYWAFYVNGEYGMTGVDQTAIEAGATYAFKVSK